jgi:glutamate carboxypeptidase
MKAGIAIYISAMRWMQAQGARPRRPLTVLFTADEETGSQTSQSTIEELARKAGVVFCLEPALPNGELKTARKGIGEIKLRVQGVAAHAGSDHEKGRNAIEELAYHILSAQKLTDYSRGTTVNVGLIGGGTRTNVVPDDAWADVDFRVTTLDEVERLQSWVNGLESHIAGTRVQASLMLDRPPMPHDALMAQTYNRARLIAAGIGLALEEGSTGGGSDANFVAQFGVPVLDGLGGVGDGAHSEREYVLEDSLAERAALLTALLLEW